MVTQGGAGAEGGRMSDPTCSKCGEAYGTGFHVCSVTVVSANTATLGDGAAEQRPAKAGVANVATAKGYMAMRGASVSIYDYRIAPDVLDDLWQRHHQISDEDVGCWQCGEPWPCAIVRWLCDMRDRHLNG